MKKIFFSLAIIFLVTLQISWPRFLSFFNCKPDLLLIFAVGLFFYLNFRSALIFCILAGLAKDVFLPFTFAQSTILFSIWGYLTYRLSRQISTENDYVRIAVILIVAFLNNIIIGLESVYSGNIIPLGIFLRNLMVTSFFTALLSNPVFKLINRLNR